MRIRARLVVRDERLRNMTHAMRLGVRRAIKDTLDEGLGLIKQSMAEAKSGPVYKVSATGKEHQASAPGEAPAIDLSNLVNSLFTGMEDDLRGHLYVGADYAIHLELGAPEGNLEPRPFIAPVWNDRVFSEHYSRRIKDALDRAAGGTT